MENFERDLMQRIQSNIMSQVSKAEFINTGYGGTKLNLPISLLEECYNRIDVEKLKTRIVARLEEEVADKLVNKMMTEYANDVKQIMSNGELREELRGILRTKIKETKALLE